MSAIDIVIGVLFAGGSYYLTSNIVFAIAILIITYLLYSFKVGLIVTLVIGSILAYVIASYLGYPVNIFAMQMPVVPSLDLSNIGKMIQTANSTTTTLALLPATLNSTSTTIASACNSQCCANEDCKTYNGQYQFCCTNSGCNRCECKLDGDCMLGYHCSSDKYCTYGSG